MADAFRNYREISSAVRSENSISSFGHYTDEIPEVTSDSMAILSGHCKDLAVHIWNEISAHYPADGISFSNICMLAEIFSATWRRYDTPCYRDGIRKMFEHTIMYDADI